MKKPRTYRNNARKEYLETAQNKKTGKKKIRKAKGKPRKRGGVQPNRELVRQGKNCLRHATSHGQVGRDFRIEDNIYYFGIEPCQIGRVNTLCIICDSF